MSYPSPTNMPSRQPLHVHSLPMPEARKASPDGRSWAIHLTDGSVQRGWGRVKLEADWAFIVDNDADGVGFVVVGAPLRSILFVESTD